MRKSLRLVVLNLEGAFNTGRFCCDACDADLAPGLRPSHGLFWILKIYLFVCLCPGCLSGRPLNLYTYGPGFESHTSQLCQLCVFVYFSMCETLCQFIPNYKQYLEKNLSTY